MPTALNLEGATPWTPWIMGRGGAGRTKAFWVTSKNDTEEAALKQPEWPMKCNAVHVRNNVMHAS